MEINDELCLINIATTNSILRETKYILVSVLSRHGAKLTKRHWAGIKTILRYTKILVYFLKNQDQALVGYTDVGYLLHPHNARPHTSFVFICGGTVVSWISCKQPWVATTTNHSEILASYEAARECA